MREFSEKTHAALDELTHEHLAMPVPAANQPDVPSFDHWRLVMDQDTVLWAILDKKKASANTLSEDVLRELDGLMDAAKELKPKGLVIRSAKKSGFVAGAEISEFVDLAEDTTTVTRALGEGLRILDKIENFPAPTIALVHGYCLGGGLELALACKYRIARNDTKLGFPEVMLGLHPGLAGTWRSLAIMDPVNAVTMMITGKSLIAKKAKAQGLVDATGEERHFAEAVKWAVAGKLKKKDGQGLKSKTLNFSPARGLIARKMAAEVAKKAKKKHYPAPYAMIDLWREYGDDAYGMRAAETRSFAKLMASDTSRNLVRAFFLREKLKGYAKGKEHGMGHVHVIGAGVMGGDIAAWCALRGFRVTLQDREIKYIAPAIKRAARLFKRRIYNAADRQAAMDRLIPDVAASGIAGADLIIEAVPENPDIKHSVYAQCEAAMKPSCILATNTSSILLENLRDKLKHPERFCGIHFFNPVASMPLVEVVTHDGLDGGVRDQVLAFVSAIDKLPLPVRSAPGFLVNRALTPYMSEAFAAYSEGIRPEVIDQAMEDFGMPMGPIELADTVGLDVAMHVAKVLKRDLEREMPDVPDWFEKLVAQKHLGKKSGKGIYTWVNGKPQKAKIDQDPDKALADRLVLPLINAVADCMGDGIIEDSEACDAGMIFGTGFAPFLGGPVNYARARGTGKIISELERLANMYGPRFTPSSGWGKLK